MHWMTFEYLGGNFHCGKPWDAYGIPFALPDCSSIEGPQGSAAPVQNFLNFGAPESPHDTSGYPKMTAWGPGNLTYEGTYWRWIQRAWLGVVKVDVTMAKAPSSPISFAMLSSRALAIPLNSAWFTNHSRAAGSELAS